ncbi:hypothetical protein BofuT4_uP118250.1 [Botrytis cinerea T4]|uniref:Uncharacterized protein n=1 Tax=Botryotinia fuckeliana (strain T4) TaxID=999810 RepID=G2Y0W0_BOTF4|nr:hypothetical protein BofuT4_uP118250.1 [Botrytis cinerea T4]
MELWNYGITVLTRPDRLDLLYFRLTYLTHSPHRPTTTDTIERTQIQYIGNLGFHIHVPP